MSNMTATQHLEIIREKNRPTVNDYIPAIFNHFTELHGDRHYGDDAAILSGIATLNSTPVTVIAQVKGRNLEENKKSSFTDPLSALLIHRAHSAELKPKKEVRARL